MHTALTVFLGFLPRTEGGSSRPLSQVEAMTLYDRKLKANTFATCNIVGIRLSLPVVNCSGSSPLFQRNERKHFLAQVWTGSDIKGESIHMPLRICCHRSKGRSPRLRRRLLLQLLLCCPNHRPSTLPATFVPICSSDL